MQEADEVDFAYPSSVAAIDLLNSCSADEKQLAEQKRTGRKKVYMQPVPNNFRVYMLRESTDGPCSYVGSTPRIPEVRLLEHNEGKERGALETKGKQWKICRVYMGFQDKSDMLSFEGTINRTVVAHGTQRLKVIESVCKMGKWQYVEEDPQYTDDDL